MDLTDTIIPNSAQINAEDLLNRSVTVTITGVEQGNAEQPVNIHLAEFSGRTYRPGKSMRRVLVAAWGPEASAYTGRRLTLYNDPTIRFGKDVTGGIRISHMSHIDGPLKVNLTVTRGKRAPFTVQPLPDAAPTRPAPTVDPILVSEWCETFNAAETVAQLQAAWEGASKAGVAAHPDVIAAKDKRKGEIA